MYVESSSKIILIFLQTSWVWKVCHREWAACGVWSEHWTERLRQRKDSSKATFNLRNPQTSGKLKFKISLLQPTLVPLRSGVIPAYLQVSWFHTVWDINQHKIQFVAWCLWQFDVQMVALNFSASVNIKKPDKIVLLMWDWMQLISYAGVF